MKTNIDHLHKVVSGEVQGRRIGKTFARIHELASCLEVSNIKNGIVYIQYEHDMQYLLPMIRDVFHERSLEYSFRRPDNILICNGVIIRFIPYQERVERLRGIGDHFEVMMRHND